jgi:hypothetical protein
MAKSKLLPLLTHRGSSLKSSSEKKDAATAAPATNKSAVIKSHEEVLILLSNFPESESESDRELSFSFLVNNSPPKKDGVPQKGGKTEEQCREGAAVKEKRKRRSRRNSSGSGQIGVLLNFHVPVPLPDNSRSRSGREKPCTTLAEIEKRYMLIKFTFYYMYA